MGKCRQICICGSLVSSRDELIVQGDENARRSARSVIQRLDGTTEH